MGNRFLVSCLACLGLLLGTGGAEGNGSGAGRSTGVRSVFGRGYQYGNPATEAAAYKALRWLKLKQNADGSWPGVPAASTGLAVLTYLAHGEVPSSKEFGDTVYLGLDYLVKCVSADDGNDCAFPIATYALCEAYGMTKIGNLREAAEKGLARIIAGQTATGGWNRKLDKTTTAAPDDLSMGGWAMQALKAGQLAGLRPEGMDECIKKAVECLKTRNFDKRAGFVDCSGSHGGGLAGVGCLCLQLFGHAKDDEVSNALDVMRDWLPTFDKKHMSGGSSSQYYSYFATRCKYFAGRSKGASKSNFKSWEKWNQEMSALYVKALVEDKNADGSPVTVKDSYGKDKPVGHWRNNDACSLRGDGVPPVMDTCLCALQLMVYYRYLPTTSLRIVETGDDADDPPKHRDGEVKVIIDI